LLRVRTGWTKELCGLWIDGRGSMQVVGTWFAVRVERNPF
jgi:hypothetical protein